jgi:predicted ribosomally synthesized peptide with SipW-like signal peptide
MTTKQKPQQVSKRMQKRAEQRRKKRMTQIYIIALVVVMVVGATWAYFSNKAATQKAEESFPSEVSVDEAYQMYQEDAFVLDVRTQEEWDEFHVPGTTLIPKEELASRIDEVPLDQDVVVVCRSGNRSQEGRDILLDAGFERVTSMTGGLNAWRDAGYPIE